MTPFHALLALFAAGFAGMVAVFHRYYYKPEQEEPINPITMPEPVQMPQIQPIAVDKVRICAMAQQGFEGWFPGSSSQRHLNPGNLKGLDGNFLTFKTYEEGFVALEDYIRRVVTGQNHAYPKGGATTIFGYTHIFTGDPEPAPSNYAVAIARALGVPPSTAMSYLLT